MKKIYILLLVFLLVSCGDSKDVQDFTGYYEGGVDVMGNLLPMTLELEQGESLNGFLDIAVQGVYGLPLQDVVVEGSEVGFSINAGGSLASFSGTYKEGVITGDFMQSGQTFAFKFEKTEKVLKKNRVQLKVENAGINISGEYIIPDVEGPMPVVLIIAGSGPTDMNGNSAAGVAANSYLYLAEALEKEGIASLRYNKRIIGNTVKESDLSFDDFVDDAVFLTEMLKEDERFSDVYLIGHSQGALIAELVAIQSSVDKVVLLAGAGHPIDLVLYDQLSSQLDASTLEQAKIIMDQIKNGDPVGEIPTALNGLFRESVQAFLASWFKYDPVELLDGVEAETLIVVGTADLQVALKEGQAFEKSEKAYVYKEIENMNHVLKETTLDPNENYATYQNIDLPIHSGLINVLIEFFK